MNVSSGLEKKELVTIVKMPDSNCAFYDSESETCRLNGLECGSSNYAICETWLNRPELGRRDGSGQGRLYDVSGKPREEARG
jgi:hypothetical protein